MCLVSGMGVARIFSKGGKGKVGGGGGGGSRPGYLPYWHVDINAIFY